MWIMSKSSHVSLRLDPDLLLQIDAAPGTNRTEKVRRLLTQIGAVSALLDEQRAMLAQVQKVVANLHQQPQQNQAAPTAPNASIPSADLAAIFQAMALVSRAVSKPMIADEVATFSNSKFCEIAARAR